MKKSLLILSVLLLFVFLHAPCFAESSFIRQCIMFLNSDHPVSFQLQAQFIKLPQFDERRTEKLNRLLRHITMKGVVDSFQSEMTLSIDGDDLFSWLETNYDNETYHILKTASGHSCLVPSGADSFRVSDGDTALFSDVLQNVTVYQSLDVYFSFFSSLPQQFPESTNDVKISEKYPGYGTAVRKTTITLSGEALTEAVQNMPDIRDIQELIPVLKNIVFTGRQRFTLLYTDDNSLIKINYSGNAGYSTGDIRTVRLDWKTVRKKDLEKDELQLRTPNSDGTKRDNFLLEHEWKKAEDNTEQFIWKAETDRLSDGIRTRGMTELELKTDNEGKLTGKYTVTATVRSQSISGEADLAASLSDDGHCSGTLEIISKKDKIETSSLNLFFDLSQDVPVQVADEQPDPEIVTADGYSEILDHLYQSVLRSILHLPEEDLVFLKEGIPDESWDSIMNSLLIKEPEP